MTELSLPLALPTGQLFGTRSSQNWAVKPSRFDPLNTRYVWARTGKYDIPALENCEAIPTLLAPWSDPKRCQEAQRAGGAIHFFLDDYRFEPIWANPEKYLPRVAAVGSALTPDFSIWRDMPVAAQIWQVYRSRWLGVYWQYNGIDVIPTVSWGGTDTYEFAFEGLPLQSALAVSAVGTRRDRQARDIFAAGIEELCRQTNPSRFFCYGSMPAGLTSVPVLEYPDFWQTKKGR